MNTPRSGLIPRALVAVAISAAWTSGAFLLLVHPRTRASFAALPPVLFEPAGAALAALLFGFAAGTVTALLLFREPDRAARLALAALQGDGTPADDSETAPSGDLREVAERLDAWRNRARRADVEIRRLEEAMALFARRLEAMPPEDYRPLTADGDPGEHERRLLRAVNGVLDTARQSRESTATLLGRIEEDMGRAVKPLEGAERRMTAGSSALDRSLVTMSRALARLVQAAEGNGSAPGAVDEAREPLEAAVKASYEARFALEECLKDLDRARRAGGHVEREVAAVRRRFGGADVTSLSDEDLVTENGTESTDPEDTV